MRIGNRSEPLMGSALMQRYDDEVLIVELRSSKIELRLRILTVRPDLRQAADSLGLTGFEGVC